MVAGKTTDEISAALNKKSKAISYEKEQIRQKMKLDFNSQIVPYAMVHELIKNKTE